MSVFGAEFRAARIPFAASLLGRLTYSAQPLILFEVLHQGAGTFTAAGAMAAVFGLVCALTGPLRARFIDRRGPRGVMTALGLGYATAMTSLALAVQSGSPSWVYWPLVVAAGLFAPPMGILMRALWAELVPAELLARALGTDAAAEEVVYIVGPMLSGLTLATVAPSAAMVATAAVMGGAGVLLGYAAHSGTPVSGAAEARQGTLLEVLTGLVPALLAVAASGGALSIVWLAVVALPSAASPPGGAGGLLTLLALGSAAGALVHGRLPVAVRPLRRLLACSFATAVVLAGLGALPYLWVWAAGLPLLGAFGAPVMVNAYLLAGRTPSHLRAQAGAYVNTAFNAATACGGAGAGLLVDGAGPGAAVLAAAGVAASLTAIAALVPSSHRRSVQLEGVLHQ
ncbi:MFS transporter [Sphaerisporangium fuscum]|uniref:MFS transporter n=1 Tax=Sphaerisporangium fuscum TaxID=2835868 RepID=UPI001BDDB946|nr:MFS transporter [Sphaerisporangium fuscum]